LSRTDPVSAPPSPRVLDGGRPGAVGSYRGPRHPHPAARARPPEPPSPIRHSSPEGPWRLPFPRCDGTGAVPRPRRQPAPPGAVLLGRPGRPGSPGADGGPDRAGRGGGLRFRPRGRLAGAEPAPAPPPAVEPQPWTRSPGSRRSPGLRGTRGTPTCAAGRTACWSASRSAAAACAAGGNAPAGPPPPALTWTGRRPAGRTSPAVVPSWPPGSGLALGETEPVARIVAHDRLDAVGALGRLLGELDAAFGQRRVVALAVGRRYHPG